MNFNKPRFLENKEPTAEVAMDIYNCIKMCGNWQVAFRDKKLLKHYTIYEYQKVNAEGDRVIRELNNNSINLSTKQQVIDSVSSNLLDVSVVLTDIMDGKTWAEFKAQFEEVI